MGEGGEGGREQGLNYGRGGRVGRGGGGVQVGERRGKEKTNHGRREKMREQKRIIR